MIKVPTPKRLGPKLVPELCRGEAANQHHPCGGENEGHRISIMPAEDETEADEYPEHGSAHEADPELEAVDFDRLVGHIESRLGRCGNLVGSCARQPDTVRRAILVARSLYGLAVGKHPYPTGS